MMSAMNGSNWTTTTKPGSNWTTTTKPDYDDDRWINLYVVFEVINAIVLAIALWVLVCMIVYGTKTGRWRRRPRTSRLNDGLIYVTCTLSVAMLCLQIATNHVVYALPRMFPYASSDERTKSCEKACDAAVGVFFVSYCCSYCFLWLRQRLIFMHPYVKDKIRKSVKLLSRSLILILVASWIIVLWLHVISPDSYSHNSYSCIERPEKLAAEEYKMVALILCTTVVIVMFSAYPAVCVKFAPTDAKNDGVENADSDATSSKHRRRPLLSFVRDTVATTIGNDKTISPIHMSVRRTVLSSVIMAVSVVITVLVAETALPQKSGFPITGLWLVYNINSVVYIMCMVGTFGFASRILCLPCLVIPRPRRSPRVPKNEVDLPSSPAEQNV